MVVVETQDGGAREELGETIEQCGVGAVPGVDGLSGVAHHEEVAAVPEPRLEQAPLGRVHVLELVDEHVTDAPALRGGRGLVAFEQRRTLRHEVVEVEDVASSLLAT